MSKLFESDKMLLRFNKIYGNRYDYSKVIYNGVKKKIKVICLIHGIFEVTPKNHLRGQGCPKCDAQNPKKRRKLSIVDFKIKAINQHGKYYGYDLVDLTKTNKKIKIICPKHGIFLQRVSNHLSGQGCPDCGFERASNIRYSDIEIFINKGKLIHDNKYKYNKSIYVDGLTQLIITCPLHGDFRQKPREHLQGKGCSKCGANISKPEKEIIDFLKVLNIDLIENDRDLLSGKEIDIYMPEYKLGIEFDGLYYHSNIFLNKKYHLNKTEECEKQGIRLLHIFEDEWYYKKEIIKSIIKSKLGIVDNKIYGRKTEVKEIQDNKMIRNFLDKNHLQGFVGSKIKIGLFYDNELVSIMTFGKKRIAMGNRINNDGEYEMLRFCNKLNTQIIGGASKILSYFIKTYQPKSILSFADRRYSIGNLYKKLGFEYIGNSKPNYWYFKTNKLKKYHRFNFRKDILVKAGYDSNKTEKQIMSENNYYHIYDSGNLKFKLIL